MARTRKEQELSMEEEIAQREKEQALMDEFIRTKGITMCPPDDRLEMHVWSRWTRSPKNGRRAVKKTNKEEI